MAQNVNTPKKIKSESKGAEETEKSKAGKDVSLLIVMVSVAVAYTQYFVVHHVKSNLLYCLILY